MLTAVEFDNQAPRDAAEIGEVRTDTVLPAEFESLKALGPQMQPQLALLIRGRGTKPSGAKLALIERNLLGGQCFNVGCVPSKAIIRTSRVYAEMRTAENFGAQVPGGIDINFQAAMERMRRVRARISRRRCSAQQLNSMGIDVYFGEARFAGPRSVAVDGKTLRFKKTLIATGARPQPPRFPGLPTPGF